MLQTEGSISPIMLWDERVGVANDQPQRVVLGAPGRRAQSPTHTSANAETLPPTLPHTHRHTLTHTQRAWTHIHSCIDDIYLHSENKHTAHMILQMHLCVRGYLPEK